jgi:hypothetical protein
LRINPQGTKTWQVMVGDKRQRITIGHYPDTNLKTARALALNPFADRGSSHVPKSKLTSYTAAEAVDRFIELHHATPGRFLARHAAVSLEKITTSHIVSVTDGLAHLPSEQMHVHRALKTLFN